MDNLTDSEKKRLELIKEIQNMYNSGESIQGIVKITGKAWMTIKKYINCDAERQCRRDVHSQLEQDTDFIIQCIKNGLTASNIAAELLKKGRNYSRTNIRIFVKRTAEKYGLELSKYAQKATKYSENGEKKQKTDYVTRRGIMNCLWNNIKLSDYHYQKIWMQYPFLAELERCIREFREIFQKKNMPYLYIFIERYKNSEINEIASLANGFEKDIAAVENAVASPLNNGFVEGTNSKVKTIKKTMYGKCGKLLLSAKLMYKTSVKN